MGFASPRHRFNWEIDVAVTRSIHANGLNVSNSVCGGDDGLLLPRQKQIATLMADDFTTKEIGERLEIRPETVEFHRDLIRHRLSVTGLLQP